MTTTVLRPVGYTGSFQELTWNGGASTAITAYLWGGGGGGGGNDSAAGGNGGGAGYAVHEFTVDPGDVVGIAVGGGGGAGYSGATCGGGHAGASFAPMIFSSLNPPSGQPTVYKNGSSAYCGFLNTYGVWEYNPNAGSFDRTYTVNFPITGSYTFTGSCDNYGYAYLDGDVILNIDGFKTTYSVSVTVTAGNHTIRERGINTGGPGAFALTVTNNASSGYNGGFGGGAGPSGSSGAGGGGGGATVLLLNGDIIAVAGGGGAGGGGGNSGSLRVGQSAPGDRGTTNSYNNGQDGRTKPGDGGGGGAGGGGYYSGQGGDVRGGDGGGLAGVPGTSFANTETAAPSGRNPGGRTSPFYSGTPGQGGLNTRAGTNGYAAIVFDLPGTFVNVDGTFTPVSKIWVKNNNVWSQVRQTAIKVDGVWESTLGGMPPAFISQAGEFGTVTRPWG